MAEAVGDQPAVESLTREVVAGETITIRAKFRKFASLSEAFDLHGRLLATAPVYRPAMRNKDDPDAFADALTGVYCKTGLADVVFVFACTVIGGTLALTSEADQHDYFALDALPHNTSPRQVQRLHDAAAGHWPRLAEQPA